MKLLVLATMYPNSVYYLSGIFIHEQVKELKKLGVEVEVLALVPWSPPIISHLKKKWKKLRNLKYVEEIEGVKVYHPRYIAIPGGFLKHLWPYGCFFSLKKFFKRYVNINKFNLLHVQGALPEDFTGYLISKRFKIPYVLTVHGSSVYYAAVKSKRQFKKSAIAIENAAYVVAVSENVKNRIIRFTHRKKKIVVIYNGFHPVQLPEAKPSRKIVIMFGATLIERKGLRYLLFAFEKLIKSHNNIELWVAGGGELLGKCKKLAQELNIFPNVKFYGTVSHSKMLELMNQCDIFVLPSWDEAFGVVYLEAMSLKKPVIGTLGEGISEIIFDGENGFLVEPKNVEDLKNKLSQLLTSKKLRTRIGKKGFETVRELTWTKNAEKNIAVYRKVLGLKDEQ